MQIVGVICRRTTSRLRCWMWRQVNWQSGAWSTRAGRHDGFMAAGWRVGIEAAGHTRWFERMLAEMGHEVWIGDGTGRAPSGSPSEMNCSITYRAVGPGIG
jgi:hypothetical protein